MKINFKIILIIIISCLLVLEIYSRSSGFFLVLNIIYPIPSILFFFYYVFILKGKNLLFSAFILFDALSIASIYITEYNTISYYLSMAFSIICYVCFLIYIVKKIDLQFLMKRHLPYAIPLGILTIYMIYSLNNSILNNGNELQISNIVTEVIYNVLLTAILIVSFINYAYNDSKKEFFLLLFCTGLVFSEIIFAIAGLSKSTKILYILDLLISIFYFMSYIFLIYYLDYKKIEKDKDRTLNSIQN